MPDERPLHALGGQPAPPDVARDLALVLELPPSARARLWEILGPCLVEPLPDTIEGRLDTFCRAHQAPPELLAPALKACRFLVWRAGSLGVPKERFAEDLASLCGEEGQEVAEILLAGYDPAVSQVRSGLLRGALSDHGNVLEGVDWRVDHVATSNRGGVLRAPVGVLTLRYRAGGKDERLTVQLVPEALRALHQACESLAAAAKRST